MAWFRQDWSSFRSARASTTFGSCGAVKLITDFLLELEEIPDIFQKSVYVAEIDLRMANAC
jgi:hypothetical protein